ncbi:MAG: hypothetical protein KKD64_00940 [Alphaproteobacteria bacterium]|nr:hypothetical protein [Alphaproteobacteria bacterium]MBU0793905.1 hypothetical protein [Alphaproteobacteria bacterium]MBU0876281.1 hypothetical protein [Alphaproteobacteria bacterium]MBU1768206.1 hypothetical protein [Alphaproteobacteria bacterium]
MAIQAQWHPVLGTSLEMALTDRAGNAVFDAFFAGYDRAFVLPNEKEDAAGFAACLALNHDETGARLAREHGPFAEVCLIARESGTTQFVGGANFIAMSVRDEDGMCLSANLNYIYIDEGARGRGRLSAMLAAVRQAILEVMNGEGEPLVFIELNDPFAMSPQDYVRDTAFTGIDQLDRLRIWAKRGARVIDFPYIQPPLTPDAEPDESLIYGVLSAEADLPACTLLDHLRKFFAISVLKGAPLASVPSASAQIDALEMLCAGRKRIALLDPAALLSLAGQRDEVARAAGRSFGSVREALHLLGD